MRSRSFVTGALALLVTLAAAETASAQQALNLSAGYFAIRGEDGRVDDDVLVANRELFLFDFSDFGSASIGAEYLVPIGEYLEASAGIAFTSRRVPTIYEQFVQPNGDEIEQELKLRVVPLTATVRVLPLGRSAAIQPYVGGGIGVFNWRYSETGDFINFTLPGRPLFRDSFVADGTEIGPVAVFGVRVPLDRFAVGGEVRYQKADTDLNEDFLGSRLDLGGWHYVGTFAIRF
ncbi:MAG: hypothetical protein LC791_16380 [Acidobacteria bacterium]|nr:hypothetical protein [Acidobacteriota bacterium]